MACPLDLGMVPAIDYGMERANGKKASKTPTLDRLMSERLVSLDATGTYVGIASDGTMVQFGVALRPHHLYAIESYLTANPSPANW